MCGECLADPGDVAMSKDRPNAGEQWFGSTVELGKGVAAAEKILQTPAKSFSSNGLATAGRVVVR